MDDVIDNRDAGRFELTVEGQMAFADYQIRGDRMVLPHTVVPRPLEGRGLAARLVKAALERARAEGLKVVSACSYVAAYMKRHPETQDLLA